MIPIDLDGYREFLKNIVGKRTLDGLDDQGLRHFYIWAYKCGTFKMSKDDAAVEGSCPGNALRGLCKGIEYVS